VGGGWTTESKHLDVRSDWFGIWKWDCELKGRMVVVWSCEMVERVGVEGTLYSCSFIVANTVEPYPTSNRLSPSRSITAPPSQPNTNGSKTRQLSGSRLCLPCNSELPRHRPIVVCRWLHVSSHLVQWAEEERFEAPGELDVSAGLHGVRILKV
jgi:hypothetical protein